MARALVRIHTNKIPKLVKLSNTQVQLPAGIAPTSLTVTTSVSGVGGLDTGTVAASTFYYVYLVNGVSLIASISGTSPTGYTVYRKVGAFYTDGSSNVFKAYYYGETNTIALGATINASGTLVDQSRPNWVLSTSISSNIHTLNFNTNFFSTAPTLQASSLLNSNTATTMINSAPSTSSVSFITRDSSSGIAIARVIYVSGAKQGIDATQPDWSL